MDAGTRRSFALAWRSSATCRRLALLLLVPLCLLMAPAGVSRPSPAPPKVGFSFTPNAARYANHDPGAALTTLLDRIQPDLVRLPIYWEDVAPTPTRLDFSEVDGLIQRVRQHNREAQRPARLILTVGARNLGFPELFVPAWVTVDQQRDVPAMMATAPFHSYLTQSILHYRSEPLLDAWQVENEPFDNVVSGAPASVRVPAGEVHSEVDEVHHLDPGRPAVVTSYNSATLDLDELGISPLRPLYRHVPVPAPTGHPQSALDAGDILGLDVYVSTPSTAPATAAQVDATPGLTVDQRIRWKRDLLDYWAQRAHSVGKDMWVMEMQAGSWPGDRGFSTHNLLASATQYADGSASVVLLWGVESWLIDATWMRQGSVAVAVLRGEDPNHSVDL